MDHKKNSDDYDYFQRNDYDYFQKNFVDNDVQNDGRVSTSTAAPSRVQFADETPELIIRQGREKKILFSFTATIL